MRHPSLGVLCGLVGAGMTAAGGGLAASLAVPLVSRHARRRPEAWRWLRASWWRGPEPAFCAFAPASVVALSVATLPIVPIAPRVIARLHNPGIIGLALALLSLACLTAAGATFGLVRAVLRALFVRSPRHAVPAVWAALGLLVGCVGCVITVMVWSPTLTDLDLSALWFLVAGALGAFPLALGIHAQGPASGARAWRARYALVGLVLIATAFGLDRVPRVASVLLVRTALVRPVILAAQRLIDRDRDGSSPLFAGGDCNDRDPGVRPGRYDIPGDGIDQNCSGADATIFSRAPSSSRPTHQHQGPAPDILLISVDTLRPDHLGAYGYPRPTSPNIDAFAARGVRFSRAYSSAPRTIHALAAMFTGCIASEARWGRESNFPTLLPSNPLIAPLLAARDYHTLAVGPELVFSGVPGILHGFQQVRLQPGLEGPGASVVTAIQRAVAEHHNHPGPIFAWAHLAEPHEPFVSHPDVTTFGTSDIDRYDEEIAYVDRVLRPILAWAQHPPRDRPMVVMFVADHGESFGEHGQFYHSNDLHDEQIRIPWIIAGSGISPGVLHQPVSLASMAATLLGIAQIHDPHPRCAIDLSGLIFNPRTQDPGFANYPVIFELRPGGTGQSTMVGIVQGNYKLINWHSRGVRALFDLRADPAERNNLIGDLPDVAGNLTDLLDAALYPDAQRQQEHSRRLSTARLGALQAPQHPQINRVEDVLEFLGHDIASSCLFVGQTLEVAVTYRPLRTTSIPLLMGLSLEGRRVSGPPPWWIAHQLNLNSPLAGTYPTTHWVMNERIRDNFTLLLLHDIPPGEYTLYFQANYDIASGRQVAPGQRVVRIPLQTITITPAPAHTTPPPPPSAASPDGVPH